MSSGRLCSWATIKGEVCDVAEDTWTDIRNTRPTPGLFLAIFCVAFVLVGNVVLLIAINFWLSIFPSEEMASNSSQIAIQVVVTIFLLLFFLVVTAIFAAVFGAIPLWRALVSNDRMGHPAYRLFLLFMSGASNGLCGLLATYAMTYTPEFIQAVLLCAIPFSAQAWTVIFIPEERHRNYLSVFFLVSIVFFIGGVLLSSLNSFINVDEQGRRAPWSWALIYLASSVLFGLWCVVQRLYLDAIMMKDAPVLTAEDKAQKGMIKGDKAGTNKKGEANDDHDGDDDEAEGTQGNHRGRSAAAGERDDEMSPPKKGDIAVADGLQEMQTSQVIIGDCSADDGDVREGDRHTAKAARRGHKDENNEEDDDDDDEREENDEDAIFIMDPTMSGPALIAEKRSWGRQGVNDNAAKLVLLVGGVFFQLLVSFVCFPIDAIPWFGTSSTAREAWDGFARSVNFIFASWFHVRHGLLYALGYAMSFIGCTYLNEHSPTLASVVLQLAGPITSIVILAVPAWNVYKDHSNVGQKVGGALLLLVAAILYHMWEQNSMKRLLARAQAEREAAAAVEPVAAEAAHPAAHRTELTELA